MKRGGSYYSLANLGAVPVQVIAGPASARETPTKRKPGSRDMLAALRRGAAKRRKP